MMRAEPVLEFDELRELLGRYVRSPLGRAELSSVAPGNERATTVSTPSDEELEELPVSLL